MKKFIIDGNNLIGKIKSLQKLQKNQKQSAREILVFKLERFFHNKKIKVSIHFDGYKNEPIKVSYVKIFYSENKTADEKIKDEIGSSKNPKNITLITSDNNLKEFGKVCGCFVINSEVFAKDLDRSKDKDEEEERIKSIDNVEEFKRIFNVKK
jgi:uncharacterized protein